MTSAFGGQRSIQLSYGCWLNFGRSGFRRGARYKENGPALQSEPVFLMKIGNYIQVATPP